jgi:hypothetical protein
MGVGAGHSSGTILRNPWFRTLGVRTCAKGYRETHTNENEILSTDSLPYERDWGQFGLARRGHTAVGWLQHGFPEPYW